MASEDLRVEDFEFTLEGGEYGDENDKVQDVEDDGSQQAVAQSVQSNVQLLALLEKGNHRGFRELVDLPANLEDNDDVDLMLKLMDARGGNSGAKVLFKNLFNVLCCLAGESLDPAGMSAADQLLNLNTKFLFWLTDIGAKGEFTSGLLRHFPGQKLPEPFGRYVKTLQVVPTKTNGVGHMTPEQQKCAKFGGIVKSHFDLCKREINGSANPLWIAPSKLPSGVSEYAYTYFMRKQLWPVRAMELAKNAAKAATNRQKRKGSSIDIEAPEARLLSYDFDPNWYPDWWLVYLYLGEPAADNCRISFVSGKAALTVKSLSDIRDMASRSNRKAIDRALAESSEGTASADRSTGPKKQRIDIFLRNPYAESQLQVRKDRIAMLKETMSTLKLLDIPTSDEQYQTVLRQLLSEQMAALEEMKTDDRVSVQPPVFETPSGL